MRHYPLCSHPRGRSPRLIDVKTGSRETCFEVYSVSEYEVKLKYLKMDINLFVHGSCFYASHNLMSQRLRLHQTDLTFSHFPNVVGKFGIPS